MEVPCLALSSIFCLNDHVLVVDQVKVSVRVHFSSNVEVSINVETEVFVEFTLLWFCWVFIFINDIPLLVKTLMSVPSNDVSVFVIKTACYIKDLSFLVDNVGTLLSPELPPS